MESKKISLEMDLTREQAIAYLEGIVEALKAGTLEVEQAERKMRLSVPDFLELEVEAKVKKGKAKFGIELSWRDGLSLAEEDELGEKAVQEPQIEPKNSNLDVARRAVQATAEAAEKATSPMASGGRTVFPKKPAAKKTGKGSPSGGEDD